MVGETPSAAAILWRDRMEGLNLERSYRDHCVCSIPILLLAAAWLRRLSRRIWRIRGPMDILVLFPFQTIMGIKFIKLGGFLW
jgi:hypothetical protein